MDTLFSINNLHVQYRSKSETIVAIQNVHMSLNVGEIGVLIGPSGCGKSTIMHILAGVKHDYSGEVLYAGRPLSTTMPKTALILQDYGLLPWKTVMDNVALGLQIRKQNKQQIRFTVDQILEQMGISYLKHRYPKELSGGQRQRVAIARALALQPELLLMDEPFSALDALTREELQELLIDLWKKWKMSILLVTHNIEEAAYLGQKIFVMSPSPGTILHTVKNDLAGDPTMRDKPEFYELCQLLRSFFKRENNLT